MGETKKDDVVDHLTEKKIKRKKMSFFLWYLETKLRVPTSQIELGGSLFLLSESLKDVIDPISQSIGQMY